VMRGSQKGKREQVFVEGGPSAECLDTDEKKGPEERGHTNLSRRSMKKNEKKKGWLRTTFGRKKGGQPNWTPVNGPESFMTLQGGIHATKVVGVPILIKRKKKSCREYHILRLVKNRIRHETNRPLATPRKGGTNKKKEGGKSF